MSDYHRLMAAEHAVARNAYSFDPRQYLEQFSMRERFSSNATLSIPGQDEIVGSYADAQSVQNAPKTIGSKRYVIIDTSQRDWVKQPNPYSNIEYSFGVENISSTSPLVYENNPFVPTFAVEQLSNVPPVVNLPNTRGWTLAGTPSNIRYPPYNSSLSKGNIIANDTGFITTAVGKGFGSVFRASNVTSLRLVRAVLPQRQFLNIPIDASATSTDASTSQFIQSTLIGKPYSTFSTYPYLMLYLNEYFGQYVGANEPTRRTFTVMTQKQRQQTVFQTDVGVQQYDYEPWGDEALKLQSPITNLQKLLITVTDPIGTPFVQTDNLTVSLIQATDNKMYLKCFTGSYKFFSSNDLRVGDRVIFYSNTITSMLQSTILTALNTQKRAFITAISNVSFPVLQLLDYVQDSNGIYVPRDETTARTKPYVSSYNGFMIPNFVTIGPDGTASAALPGSIDSGTNTVLEPDVLVGSNMPFLNVTLQPVYTLEVESQLPDTGTIGGTIVS
jgi:hypothetical protein